MTSTIETQGAASVDGRCWRYAHLPSLVEWTLALTHWGQTKMAAISQITFQEHFLKWKLLNFTWNFTEICSFECDWQYGKTLVQILVWRRTGNKPLSEPMCVCCTDAYTRQSASMNFKRGDTVWTRRVGVYSVCAIMTLSNITEHKLDI